MVEPAKKRGFSHGDKSDFSKIKTNENQESRIQELADLNDMKLLLQSEDGRFLNFRVLASENELRLTPMAGTFKEQIFKLDSIHITCHPKSGENKKPLHSAKISILPGKDHLTVYFST